MLRQRGFSLAEVLVALLVLTLVITTTLAVFLERNRRLRQASETMMAYQVLANEVEVRRRLDFNDPALVQPEFVTDVKLLDPLKPFTAKATASTDPAKPGRRTISMLITWSNGKHRAALDFMRADTGGTNLW
jgi:prepilin-type N-terminal cleavage/methylation domain-containing protein